MSPRSAPGPTRSMRTDRTLSALFGLLLLAGGVMALVVGFGWLGSFRASRPVLDPAAVEWVAARATVARLVLLVAGLLLFLLGLRWVLHTLRPESRPAQVRAPSEGAELQVSAQTVTDMVRAEAENIDGVSRAQVRLVGGQRRPGMRIRLRLQEDADVRQVLQQLDTRVLPRARESLGRQSLPTSVLLDLMARRDVGR